MTIVDDRPVTSSEPTVPASPARSWSSTASWRLAARLARREVRRRPGRTLLVALLVAIPVFAMTLGSIIARSDTEQAGYARSYGASDFAVNQYAYIDEAGTAVEPVTSDDLPAGTLPADTTSTDVLVTYTDVTTTADERIDVAATHLDVASPIVDGIIEVTEGRFPADGTDEVLVQPELAGELGVEVGDRLELARPDRTLTVVGLGRASADHGRPLLLFGQLDRSELRSWSLTTLVDLPPGTSADAALTAIAGSGALAPDQLQAFGAQTPDGYWNGPDTRFSTGTDGQVLAWGWVAGVLSLAALGVIIAAAFATSARRQLATVGQLAANGASPRLIRRTLSLQGTWSGAVGVDRRHRCRHRAVPGGNPGDRTHREPQLGHDHHRTRRHGRAVHHRRHRRHDRRAAPGAQPRDHLGAVGTRRAPPDPPGEGPHRHRRCDLLLERTVPPRRRHRCGRRIQRQRR